MFLISIKYSFIASFPSIYVRLHVLMLHVYFARKIHLKGTYIDHTVKLLLVSVNSSSLQVIYSII